MALDTVMLSVANKLIKASVVLLSVVVPHFHPSVIGLHHPPDGITNLKYKF